jgi:hypothetical protein
MGGNRSRVDDNGQATPLLTAAVGLTAMMLLALAPMGRVLSARAQARTAADAAALAGAAAGEAAADALAKANRGDLRRYESNGDEVIVEVEVGGVNAFSRAQGFDAVADAPAGTPPDGPADLVEVHGVEVNVAIAERFRGVIDHARRDGLELAQGSSGYRSATRQIELRRAHCGTSHYALYEMPPSQCSPPTARPGRSMHERGLAIDFACDGRLIRSRSNPCFVWLRNHAAGYGLYNLPSEPWHWSVDGS